jgi:orotate phosphoribosyltransferase
MRSILSIAFLPNGECADSNLLKSSPRMHFADKALTAEITARMLLEVKAVLFFEDKPFIFTSGWASPVYIDCRKLIFYPRIRSQLVDFAAATLARDVGFEQFDVIAGGETAGIPYAAWLAERLALPMQYVRKKPKGFGRNAQIEGDIREGARTLLVEDLTTDGRSKINFCKALREAGAIVEHVFVNFYYDIYPESKQILADLNVRLHYLATWWDVLALVKKDGHLKPAQIAEVEKFLHEPAKWSAAHGGVAASPSS